MCQLDTDRTCCQGNKILVDRIRKKIGGGEDWPYLPVLLSNDFRKDGSSHFEEKLTKFTPLFIAFIEILVVTVLKRFFFTRWTMFATEYGHSKLVFGRVQRAIIAALH